MPVLSGILSAVRMPGARRCQRYRTGCNHTAAAGHLICLGGLVHLLSYLPALCTFGTGAVGSAGWYVFHTPLRAGYRPAGG